MKTAPAHIVRLAAHAAAACIVLAVFMSGCGYRLQAEPGSRFTDPSVRVDLRPFQNDTVVPDAGVYMAARLREEMRRIGFRGSFDQPGADFLLEGKVREVREEVFSHGADGRALEHRLTLAVDIRVVEVVRGRLLWKETGMSETVSYFSGADFQYTESNRRAAVEEASRRVVRRIGQTVRVLL